MTHSADSLSIDREGREGIALIVTIGILALILIIAIGFATTMRVERVAARSFADSVKTRLLLDASVARAMSDINNFMTNTSPIDVYPDFSTVGGTIRVLPSLGGTGTTDPFLSDEAITNIPKDIRAEALAMENDVTWIDMYDGSNSVRMGQFAYLIIDCSGYVDASSAGGWSRGRGQDPREIQIKDLSPEFNGSAGQFTTGRASTWVRFESYVDLATVGNDSGSIAVEPVNLFPYSRFVPGVRYNETTGVTFSQYDIGGDEAEIQSRLGAIAGVLNQAGVPNSSAVAENFLDYIDGDNIPQKLDSFCTEAVPMINEIVASNSVTRNDLGGGVTEWEHNLYIDVETWHPFNSDVTIILGPVGNPPFIFSGNAPDLIPTDADLVSGPATVSHSANSFRTNHYHYRVTTTSNPGDNFGLYIEYENIDVIESGNVVDRVPASAGIPRTALALAIQGVNGGAFGTPVWTRNPGYRAISCVDPRLNYQWQNGGGWYNDVKTLGALNNNASGGEGVSQMHVRNEPLRGNNGSVAELGYLSVGVAWQTISLYETPVSPMMPVLDYFTVDDDPQPVSGLVNINTTNRQVLASIFNQLTVQPVPGSNLTTFAWSDALNYADQIITRTESVPFYNISQIGNFPRNFFVSLIGMGNGVTDADIESVIRRSYELAGIRHNLFTVFVGARLLSPVGNNVVSEAKALAIIWRDPIPNSNGHNVQFVRFFKPIVE